MQIRTVSLLFAAWVRYGTVLIGSYGTVLYMRHVNQNRFLTFCGLGQVWNGSDWQLAYTEPFQMRHVNQNRFLTFCGLGKVGNGSDWQLA